MNARQLKSSILQLAVQGKLVPQDPCDEPASVLLKSIAKERERLIQEKKIKNPKSISHILRRDGHFYETINGGKATCIDEKIPFEIPDSWEWTRLGSVFSLFSTGPFGSMVHKSDYTDLPSGIPLVNPTNIKNGRISRNGPQRVRKEKSESLANYRLSEGDIIVARRGDLSKCAIVTKDEEQWLCGTGSFFLHLSFIDSEYFCYFYASPYTQSMLLGESVGTTMVNLNQRLLNHLLFPLPPLQEQKRIVQKMKGLLPHIEEYGKHEKELSALNKAFPQALKKSLLQWAIQGKLVPQDPDDEPASVLLEHVAAEKEKLTREKKIKRPKNTSHIYRRGGHFYESVNDGKPVCIDEEIPFEIPDSWAWVRGKSLFETTQHKAPDSDFSYIDIDAIDNKHHVIKGVRMTQAKEAPSRARRLLQPGDILFSLVRPYLENVAMVETQHASAIASTGFYVVRTKAYLPRFTYALFLSPYVIQGLNAFMRGDHSPSIRGENIEDYLYPLPPLAEQGRICGKLEELLNTLKS